MKSAGDKKNKKNKTKQQQQTNKQTKNSSEVGALSKYSWYKYASNNYHQYIQRHAYTKITSMWDEVDCFVDAILLLWLIGRFSTFQSRKNEKQTMY